MSVLKIYQVPLLKRSLSLQLRETLVKALLRTQTVSNETSLSDVMQLTSTLKTVTRNPEENSENVVVSTHMCVELVPSLGEVT